MNKIVWKYVPHKDGKEHFRFTVDVECADEFEKKLKNLKCIAFRRWNSENDDAFFDVYFSDRSEKAEYEQVLSLGVKQFDYISL